MRVIEQPSQLLWSQKPRLFVYPFGRVNEIYRIRQVIAPVKEPVECPECPVVTVMTFVLARAGSYKFFDDLGVLGEVFKLAGKRFEGVLVPLDRF